MNTHGEGTLGSPSLLSPSPSHSATASATSSIGKRKRDDPATPFTTASFDGALTSNDDLESISAQGTDSNEDDYDNDNDSSMRTFTAARLNNPPSAPRYTNLKTDNSALENSDAAKDAATAGSIPGIIVTEDTTKIFTDNLQTSGAYIAREESLKKEEEAGRLKFVCVSNDGVDEHMIWLIGLKNIFARQLPNMPKEYIVRLVMDRSHKSVMVIRRNLVVGGITYRPYVSQKFGEIAFCAITANEQVKGYGTRLMNHLKQHARDVDGLTHFLTYADNKAVGYFIKQGFTKEIHLEKDQWQGFIKDYVGVTLMEYKIDPKLPYTDLSTMIRPQRQAIDEKIRELSNCHVVYAGIDFQKDEAGIPKKIVYDIPGLREAGWTPDQWGHSQFRSGSTDNSTNQKHLTSFMRSLLKSMHDHADAWPFKEPVDARDVPDYYKIIKDPMDLKTMSKRVESERYYVTLEMFVADVRRMFANACTYNSPETIYYKCATRLKAHFQSKMTAGLQSGSKIQ